MSVCNLFMLFIKAYFFFKVESTPRMPDVTPKPACASAMKEVGTFCLKDVSQIAEF